MMIGRVSFCCAAGALALFTVASSAQAEVILEVDLSVVDQITINSTTGLSAATVSGSDTTGFYLEGIFGPGGGGISESLVAGDLTSFLNTSDGGPDLFSIDEGLNVFSYTADPSSDFVAGTQALSGSATWTISAANYADLLDGLSGGSVWAMADDFSDIPAGGGSASLIGEYIVVTPAPGALAMLGLAGLVGIRRRRA
jgi:MYXO-CTERM domain-containing protein